ncbi:MAG: hypothetical protein HXY43_14410 [Fischerella sp.]|uniref:hypothetical protein n=1 Tax=Fischerella sp. TaxID=1191 RepID=UPI0017C06F07|nr:hypothetical protein [Fischerella sp.]NWF60412.1 hypothetical protein [Fischerella sp.]
MHNFISNAIGFLLILIPRFADPELGLNSQFFLTTRTTSTAGTLALQQWYPCRKGGGIVRSQSRCRFCLDEFLPSGIVSGLFGAKGILF